MQIFMKPFYFLLLLNIIIYPILIGSYMLYALFQLFLTLVAAFWTILGWIHIFIVQAGIMFSVLIAGLLIDRKITDVRNAATSFVQFGKSKESTGKSDGAELGPFMLKDPANQFGEAVPRGSVFPSPKINGGEKVQAHARRKVEVDFWVL